MLDLQFEKDMLCPSVTQNTVRDDIYLAVLYNVTAVSSAPAIQRITLHSRDTGMFYSRLILCCFIITILYYTFILFHYHSTISCFITFVCRPVAAHRVWSVLQLPTLLNGTNGEVGLVYLDQYVVIGM